MAWNSCPKDDLVGILLYGPIKMLTHYLIYTFAVKKCCPLKFRIDFCIFIIKPLSSYNTWKNTSYCCWILQRLLLILGNMNIFLTTILVLAKKQPKKTKAVIKKNIARNNNSLNLILFLNHAFIILQIMA